MIKAAEALNLNEPLLARLNWLTMKLNNAKESGKYKHKHMKRGERDMILTLLMKAEKLTPGELFHWIESERDRLLDILRWPGGELHQDPGLEKKERSWGELNALATARHPFGNSREMYFKAMEPVETRVVLRWVADWLFLHPRDCEHDGWGIQIKREAKHYNITLGGMLVSMTQQMQNKNLSVEHWDTNPPNWNRNNPKFVVHSENTFFLCSMSEEDIREFNHYKHPSCEFPMPEI